MDQGPLVAEQIEAGRKFLAEFEKYAPVLTAFWLKEYDGWYWYLYIASDQIDSDNRSQAYREVVRIARTLHDPHLDSLRTKVVLADDPKVQAALDLQRQYPGRPIHLGGQVFGGESIEGAYIYPQAQAAAVA